LSLTYPHRKKSQGVMSGDLGGQSRRCSNLFERPCISVVWKCRVKTAVLDQRVWVYQLWVVLRHELPSITALVLRCSATLSLLRIPLGYHL